MIEALVIDNPERTAVSWWPKVEALKNRTRLEFGPGLTLLWGPNGCGKSTVLRTLARLTHCEQGGTPLVTTTSLQELRSSDCGVLDGARIIGDGRPVHFLDPAAEAGLFGGGAAFDYDFIHEGVDSMYIRGTSSGQQVTAKANRIFESAAKMKEVPWKVSRQTWNHEVLERSTAALRPSEGVALGRSTLLLDEPDRSLSIPRQTELWHLFSRQERFQVIVATHSPFALAWASKAKIIDLQEGYLTECYSELAILGALVKNQGR